MSNERNNELLIDCTVRVAVSGGRRGIRIHEAGSDLTEVFHSYGDLGVYLGWREASPGCAAPAASRLASIHPWFHGGCRNDEHGCFQG